MQRKGSPLTLAMKTTEGTAFAYSLALLFVAVSAQVPRTGHAPLRLGADTGHEESGSTDKCIARDHRNPGRVPRRGCQRPPQPLPQSLGRASAYSCWQGGSLCAGWLALPGCVWGCSQSDSSPGPPPAAGPGGESPALELSRAVLQQQHTEPSDQL